MKYASNYTKRIIESICCILVFSIMFLYVSHLNSNVLSNQADYIPTFSPTIKNDLTFKSTNVEAISALSGDTVFLSDFSDLISQTDLDCVYILNMNSGESEILSNTTTAQKFIIPQDDTYYIFAQTKDSQSISLFHYINLEKNDSDASSYIQL